MNEKIRKFIYDGKDVLTLPAKPEAFLSLKDWINSILDELSVTGKPRKQLLISADEIFTNISNYAYPRGGGEAKVSVAFDIIEKKLIMTFSDNGVAYDPLTETPPPDTSLPIAERPMGGLGIFMVRKMMDSVRYRRENGLNIFTMEKFIPETELNK